MSTTAPLSHQVLYLMPHHPSTDLKLGEAPGLSGRGLGGVGARWLAETLFPSCTFYKVTLNHITALTRANSLGVSEADMSLSGGTASLTRTARIPEI